MLRRAKLLVALLLCSLVSKSLCLSPNLVVDPQGLLSGSVKTISEAITKAPSGSTSPFVIHVTKGVYSEDNLFLSIDKTNIWFVGDGIGNTIITGNKSVKITKIKTKQTSTFSAMGSGLLLQDMTIENTAGPEGEQAVALYIEADQVVVYRCEIKGYQDTLWVARHRQFYRECYVSGTIDFIFGDASVVFQNSTILARSPKVGQQNVITAQSRVSLLESSGIIIQGCTVKAAPEVVGAKSRVETYLGRPWREFATVVFMESQLDDLINPLGWLEWNSTAPKDNLYYAEYKNFGIGANIGGRVKWPSVHPNISKIEAGKFTVDRFIQGETWIKSTGVPFQGGLYS